MAGAATPVTWTWTYANSPTPAPTCAIDNGVGSLTTGKTTSVTLLASTDFTLTCSNSAGSATVKTTVAVTLPTAPKVATFSATPSSVTKGKPTTIVWSWTYANSPTPTPTCTIDQGVGTVTSGAASTVTLTADTTFKLSCGNSAGSAVAEMTLTVVPAPVAPVIGTFSASPAAVVVAQATKVTWTWSFANGPTPTPTCAIDQGVGSLTSGASTSVTLYSKTTFTLTCSSSAGKGTSTVSLATTCAPPPVSQPFVPTLATRSGVASANASASAVYMEKRSEDALRKAGAFSAIHEQVLTRLHAYGQASFGVDALLFGEAPTRWATFLPAEQAAFPDLWKLLEISAPAALTSPGAFPLLADLVKKSDGMAPLHLDLDARTAIASLATTLQPAATHIVKTPGAPAGTISYAEVIAAMASSTSYPSSEYFYFGTILRAIESLAVTPATFPHFELLGDPAQSQTINLAGAVVTVARTFSSSCGSNSYSPDTTLSTAVALQATLPANVKLTWTPLTADAALNTGGSYPTTVEVLTSSAGNLSTAGNKPWGVAIVEAWQSGKRLAQEIVRTPGHEARSAKRYGIAKNGKLTCLPTDSEMTTSSSFSNVLRLPPGRYSVPAGSYGSATLDIFGLGLADLQVGGQSFWSTVDPDAYYTVSDQCWDLTSLGPQNMVTCGSGAGPGFRLDLDTGKVHFGETSYGVCSSGGTLVATLKDTDRL